MSSPYCYALLYCDSPSRYGIELHTVRRDLVDSVLVKYGPSLTIVHIAS